MDIRHLEAFCKVYELGSFSKAGAELFVSQPTISAHIAALESELGVMLFDRLGRGILPTQAGEILYKHSQNIFTQIDKAKAEIDLLRKRVAGDLSVGASTIPAHYILPRLLSRFLAKCPEVRVSLKVGDSANVVEGVASGRYSLGVAGSFEDHPDLQFTPILEDSLIIVATPDLAAKCGRKGNPDELMRLPWIMREAGSGTRKAMEKGFESMGIDVRRLRFAVNVESTQAVIQCVRSGLGAGVTSRLAASELIEQGELVVIDVPGLVFSRSFFCVSHKRRELFPAARYFIDFLSGGFAVENFIRQAEADA